MSMLAETAITTLAFEANMSGVEIARQGMLNLTRDIQNVAYSFTNAFEGVANALLGLAGPGMFGSITIASVLLPHEKAIEELELATGHWVQSSKDDLKSYRDELTKAGDWTGEQVAAMQKAFVDSNLQIPEGMEQAEFINSMTENALKLGDAMNMTNAQAAEMLATLVAVEAQGGKAVDTKAVADVYAFAGRRGGWSATELASLMQQRRGNASDKQMPLEAAIAAGTLGARAGFDNSQTTALFDGMYDKLKKAQDEDRTWAHEGFEGSVPAGRLMGNLAAGNIAEVLKMLQQAGVEAGNLRDIGDGNLFDESDIAVLEGLLENAEDYVGIAQQMQDQSEGVAGALERIFGTAKDAGTLTNAMEGAYMALKNTFTIMAEAGVLDALTSLMKTIALLVNTFNNLPGPVLWFIALLVRLNIWFGIITSVITIVAGALLFFIMYLWGLYSIAVKVVWVLNLMARSTLTLGASVLRLGSWLVALRVQLLASAAAAQTHGVAGQVAAFALMRMAGAVALLGRALQATGFFLATNAVLARVLTWTARGLLFVYSGLTQAVMFAGRMWARQIVILWRVTAALWASVAPLVANTVATIAMGIASLFAATGLLAVSIAGFPLWAILLAIVAAVALVAAGWWLLTQHSDKVVGALQAIWTGLKRLMLVALIIGAVIAAPFLAVAAVVIFLLEKLGILSDTMGKLKSVIGWFWGGDSDDGETDGDKAFRRAKEDRAEQQDEENQKRKKQEADKNLADAESRFRETGSRADHEDVIRRREQADEYKDGIASRIGGGAARATGFAGPNMDDMQMPTGGGAPQGWAMPDMEMPKQEPARAAQPADRAMPAQPDDRAAPAQPADRAAPVQPAPVRDAPYDRAIPQRVVMDDTVAIARAREPSMNLPQGGGAVTGSRSVSIHNEYTVEVNVPPGADGNEISQLIREELEAFKQEEYRQAQTYLTGAVNT